MRFDIPEPVGAEAAFNRLKSLAESYPQEKLPQRRGDAVRARHNLYVGLKALVPYHSTLLERWNRVRVERLFANADVADASVFATDRVERLDKAEKTLRGDVSEGYGIRDLLLSTLELAAKFGLVRDQVVRAIRQGSGSFDLARDLVALAAEFRENESALRNKTPVTPALIDRAQTLGNDLLARVTPGDQKRPGATALDPKEEASALALRFFALVSDKHHEARLAAQEIWGRDYTSHVPALLAVAKP